MCRAKSFLCVRGEVEPIWSPTHDSHSKLIEDRKLKDIEIHKRSFVKVEFFPKNNNWFAPTDEWEFLIDEESTAPSWFEEERELWRDRCWTIIKKKILPQIERGHFPGDLTINADAELQAPKLESVGGYLSIYAGAELQALKSVGGDLSINAGADLQAPKLESVGGGLSIATEGKLDAPRLKR